MDDEVRIPVGFDVDTSDLAELKRAVTDITKDAERLTKTRGKNAPSLIDSQTIKNNINSLAMLEAKIGEIQTKMTEMSGRTLASDYTKVAKEVRDFAKALTDAKSEQFKLQSSLGGYQNSYNAALRNEMRMQEEIKEIRDSAKADNRELTQAEQDRIRAIQTEVDLRKKLAARDLEGAKNSYESSKESVAKYEDLLNSSKARKAELDEIIESEEKSLEYNEELEAEAQQLNSVLDNTVAKYKEIARQTKGIVDTYNGVTKGAEKTTPSTTKSNVAELNKEATAVKQSAAQYYYKLRAVKMLGPVLNGLNSSMDKFGKTSLNVARKSLNAYLKLIPGVNALKKAISGATSEQKKLARETSKSTKANNGFNLSLKDIVKNILKYGIGIRSLFVLFNKLRKAISDGMGSMAKQISDVNEKMSSIVTSMNQMKASITAAIQPLLSVLAPALEKVAAIIAEISYQIASFIAALTGQSVVYKAARIQTDYAASLDKTSKSAKKAKKELAGFDELNVLHTKDDGSGDDFGGMGWDPVALSEKAVDMANKMKEIFKRLFAPLKEAWDKTKNYIIKSWKYAMNQLKLLAKDMARDFWRMWEEAETEKIFENMLITLADIGQIVGNLAKNFREAWNTCDNGYRILASIRDIILIISDGIRKAADYTVKWSNKLSFIPALTALADNLEQKLVPAVQKVVDLFRILYEQILLKIIKDFIEKGLPQLANIIGNISTAIGNMADNIRIAIQSGSNGINIVAQIEKLIGIVADTIESCSEKTAEWASNLDFRPLMVSFRDLLKEMEPLITVISDALANLWNNTLLPFYQYLIEDGLPKLNQALGEIFGGDWSTFSQTITNLTNALEPFFELAWGTLVQIIKDLGLAIKEFLNSDELGSIVNKFKEWAENEDPEELAGKIEKLVKHLIELKAALALITKVLFPAIVGLMTFKNVMNQLMFTSDFSGLVNVISSARAEFQTFGMVMKDFGQVVGTPMQLLEQFSTALGNFAGPGGAVMAAVGAILSLKGGLDMMNNGFSLSSEVLVGFGSAVTTVGLIIAGVGAWPAMIVGAIVALIANLGAFGDDMLNWVMNTGMEIGAKIGDFFNNLGYNLGTWLATIIKTIITTLAELPGRIQNWLDTVNWAEFGLNILKGILAIFLAPVQLIGWILNAIGNFVSGFIKGLQDGFDMHSPSRKMEPYGKMILQGILQGITNALSLIGSTVSRVVNSLLSYFRSGLSSNTLLNTGYNLIVGLINGIISGFSRAYDRIREGCTNMVNIAKSIFQIGSPSKLFEQFGKWDMEGLSNGVEKGAVEAESTMEDAMNNIVPDIEPTDSYADNFLDSLTSMKQDAVDIVTSMVDELGDIMANIDSVFSVTAMTEKLNKLSAVQVPSIAQGQKLPSTASFVSGGTQTEPDYSSLANALSSAIVDAITTTSYNRTDNGDTVINIDGREVFRAVKNQNQLYKKSTGKSAF